MSVSPDNPAGSLSKTEARESIDDDTIDPAKFCRNKRLSEAFLSANSDRFSVEA